MNKRNQPVISQDSHGSDEITLLQKPPLSMGGELCPKFSYTGDNDILQIVIDIYGHLIVFHEHFLTFYVVCVI